MSLKWKELEKIIEELEPKLTGAVVQKIGQSGTWAQGASFLLQGFSEAAGPWRLWICLQNENTCACLLPLDLKPDSAAEASTFVMVLRKHLLGNAIKKVEQLPRERMFLLHFESGHSLLLELIPKRGNLVLLEQWNGENLQGRSIGSFDKVSLSAGAIYKLPPPPANVRDEMREFDTSLSSYNERVARHYWEQIGSAGFLGVKRMWRQAVKSQRKKMLTAIENTKNDLAQAQEAELFQRRGKLLVAKLYELGPRSLPKEKRITIEAEEIPLDTSKSYSDNAENFFKKSKKFTRASGELVGRVKELENRLQILDQLAEKMEAAEDEATLETLRSRAEKSEVQVPASGEKKKEKGEAEAKPFLVTESSDGFLIYCGRNQEENRRVTFQEAKGNDLWLHVKGMPGAHVVIKGQKNKTVPLSTLLEAAQITLYHSKIRKGKRAEVDYTFRKNVRAIKGTLAEVTYTGNKTLYVEADPEILKKILR